MPWADEVRDPPEPHALATKVTSLSRAGHLDMLPRCRRRECAPGNGHPTARRLSDAGTAVLVGASTGAARARPSREPQFHPFLHNSRSRVCIQHDMRSTSRERVGAALTREPMVACALPTLPNCAPMPSRHDCRRNARPASRLPSGGRTGQCHVPTEGLSASAQPSLGLHQGLIDWPTDD